MSDYTNICPQVGQRLIYKRIMPKFPIIMEIIEVKFGNRCTFQVIKDEELCGYTPGNKLIGWDLIDSNFKYLNNQNKTKEI